MNGTWRADLTIDAGPNGSASLEAARLTFTTVPEPGTSLLLLGSLPLFLLLRKRRISNQ